MRNARSQSNEEFSGTMIFHFAAYGFLKNQRYFEPFLYLALLDKGLSFFQIGVLIALREFIINAFELVSGMLADLFSRRRLLQLSFGSYALSFLILAFSTEFHELAVAMAFYGIADSFRTGTHKAMIFRWLKQGGKLAEKTKTYGFTRSWSKLGSAVAVVLGSALVLYTNSYSVVFLASIPPCLLGIVNIVFYPAELEENHREIRGNIFRTHIKETWTLVKERKGLRNLLFEAAGYEGVFQTVKDYLQPLLKSSAVLWLSGIFALPMSTTRASVFWIAPVYTMLFLFSAAASRMTHRFKDLFGGEEEACHALWTMVFWLYLVMGFGLVHEPLIAIAAFVMLHVLQNFWRPLLVSRFDTFGESHQGATLLSLESQSRRLTVIVAGPLLGWAIDVLTVSRGYVSYWPLAVFGGIVSLLFLLFYWSPKRES